MVQMALEEAHPGLAIEQKIITTTGDASTTLALHEPTAEGAGLFTKQLEEALLNSDIDLAVHSLKDLPVETPVGLTLAAILPRAPTADLLISRYEGGVENLPPGATIRTSSPRRALLMKAAFRTTRSDLVMQPIRGNVPTRLQKVATLDSYDATILAAAGLERLGHDVSSGKLEIDGMKLWVERLDWMLPAPGQGAIAVETRTNDPLVELLSPLNDAVSARCVQAERLVLQYLGGGCHLALGALATESVGMINLRAVFVPDENAAPRCAEASSPDHCEAARMVANQLLVS
jgi:hydroxymethylbilane synthase